MTAGSPLAQDEPAPVRVVLLATPLRLLVAAREHHDGLMREFRLLSLAGSLPGHATPVRLVELTDLLGRQYAAATARRDQDVDDGLARGEQVLDLVHEVDAGVADAAAALAALMVEADAFCAAEQLMTLERSPLHKRFAAWYLDQFVDQCAGGSPVPWDGPLDDDAPAGGPATGR